MRNIDALTQDYPLEPVPPARAVSGVRVAMVIIGFTITLPIFITGSRIGLDLGLTNASRAFFVGGMILASVGGFTSYVGSRTHLSTYVITQFSFGRLGGRLVNAMIAVALLGWYGVTAELFAHACQTAIEGVYGAAPNATLLCVVGSTLMTLTALWGFKALDRLSVFAVPLMMTLLVTAVVFAVRTAGWDAIRATHTVPVADTTAVSMVVGSFIVGAILLPDLCRYARRAWEGVLAAAVSLGVVFPIVFYCAMIPSLATGQSDLVLIMIALGIGLPALLLLVFATWSTNSHNLYCTALTMSSLFPTIPKWKLTIFVGAVGTVMASLRITEHFVAFLVLLGTCIPAIAGIYAADYLLLSRRRYDAADLVDRPNWSPSAFAAWLAGAAIGYAAEQHRVEFTSIPACDSIAAGFVIFLALSLFQRLAGRAREKSLPPSIFD